MKGARIMKIAERLLFWSLILWTLGYVLWRSPLTMIMEFKLDYAEDAPGFRRDDLILEMANQVDGRSRGDTYKGVVLRHAVSKRQLMEALRITEQLIQEDPRNPTLLVLKSRMLWDSGEDAAAIAELRKAKQLREAGANPLWEDTPWEEAPSPEDLEERIERLIGESKARKAEG